jgi:hypothetical protein
MVRPPPSAPAGLNRSVVRYMRMQAEDESRRLYQTRPPYSVTQPKGSLWSGVEAG